jgi:hypothetical protein
MVDGLDWQAMMALIAPTCGPTLCNDKQLLTYFTLGLLRSDVALVGKTLASARQRGEPEIGAMRSAAHVTTATAIVFDFDGLNLQQFLMVGTQVLGKGRAGLAYTTHSHGRKDKPGVRVRVVLPVDLRMDANAYRNAHGVMNAKLFSGLADETGKSLCQQQGVYGAHPERAHLAKCWRYEGDVFPLRDFLAKHQGAVAPTRHRVAVKHATPSAGTVARDLPTLERLTQAVPYLQADAYHDWTKGLMAFKALCPYYPDGSVRELAMRFGNTSPSDSTRAQAATTDPRYDPGQVFDSAASILPPDAAAGVLLGMAKVRAADLVEAARGSRTASPESRAAAAYLAAHHRQTWAMLARSGSEGRS